MPLLTEQISILRSFVQHSDLSRSAIVLDLDGTVLQEDQGSIHICEEVKRGLSELGSLQRPIILNTLRFPLSVVKKIAPIWSEIIVGPTPVVLMNGSIVGMIEGSDFSEIEAFPIPAEKIEEIIIGIEELIANDIRGIDLFYYPRSWRSGENVWVPEESRVALIRHKYRHSVSSVYDCGTDVLRKRLLAEDICMILLLIDSPRDRLLSYQHNNPDEFFTRPGVDKSFGLRYLARRLDIALLDSVGCGDTAMDGFLTDTGLSVIVGRNNNLSFRGRKHTLWVEDKQATGELLASYSALVQQSIHL